jgi:DNA polymerase-2
VRQRFPDLTYYDADILFALRHTARHRVYPLARCCVEVENGLVTTITPLGPPGIPQDDFPPLRLMTLAPDTDPEYVDPSAVTVGLGRKERRLSLHNPALFVRRLNSLIQSYDPDIILSKWGDTWLFPQALAWGEEFDLTFNPNRDQDRDVERRKAFSYHTYGRVLHRGQQTFLFGRWHIDQTNAVMYGDYELLGVFEQAGVTGLPVQETARKSPGAGITAMQIITALQQDILVPYHKQQVEDFKTPAQLIAADRGGLVGQPHTGVHYQVAGIDFFSMYPQIMARFNISPETMQVESERTLTVPGLSVPIDQSRTGFIGQSLQALLMRRYAIKQQLAHTSPLDIRYAGLKARSSALKWLLVVCFGYLGHKHFRWMKIEAHEAVTAFGRETLLQAKTTAEEFGFKVLYFNVDGLYIQKQGCTQPEDFQEVLAAIQTRTGLSINLDGLYRWIVFLPSRIDPRVPVANRYFGMFEDGEIKVRGIEMRRHDTAPYIYHAQADLLKLLTGVPEGKPLESVLPATLDLLRKRAEQLRAGQIPLDDLIVTQRLSRELSQYRQPSPAARAAAQLVSLQKPMQPGQVIHFLYIKKKPKVLAWRAGLPFNYQQINTAEYLKLLARAASNILQPLGVTERTLADLLGITGQLPLGLGNTTLFQQIDLQFLPPHGSTETLGKNCDWLQEWEEDRDWELEIEKSRRLRLQVKHLPNDPTP